MLKIENYEALGWEHAIRGMRNPKNSWDKSDSTFKEVAEIDILDHNGRPRKQRMFYDALNIGPNDMDLMKRLNAGGPVHAKYRRMIVVYMDITAPLYWWKEFDTYKVGTVANSCSTMHKIHSKPFTIDDFSHEHLKPSPYNNLLDTIGELNFWQDIYNNGGIDKEGNKYKRHDKDAWWQMIQLLPSNYNQKRTIMESYEVLANQEFWRHDHKLDEWRTFCDWIKELPYSELIVKEKEK